jgi:pSer/pThr/pTyr-binding forkhead associated (FHA) protein
VLSDDTVSRRHASLRCGDGAWFIRDLQSANGTRLNGWRVLDEVEVHPGDRVSFGALVYRLGPPQ